MLSLAKRIRETVTPARRTSAFLTQGVLTPEEFVEAGEQLVFKCPTWKWESGDSSKAKDCLPDKSKQFLVTRNVPCHRRVKALEGEYVGDTEVMFGGDGSATEGGSADGTGGGVSAILEEAWVEPHVVADPSRGDWGRPGRGGVGEDGDDDEELVLGGGADQDGVAAGLGAIQLVESHFTSPSQVLYTFVVVVVVVVVVVTSEANDVGAVSLEGGASSDGGAGVPSEDAGGGEGAGVGAEEDDCPDLDSYVEDNLMQGDEATVQAGGGAYLTAQEPDDPILPTRTYDLSITYDKHHQTPRMFLFGYDESGQPLTAEEVFEDVMQDYARQTVTMEPHPHLSSHHASVHPCKHASTMKIMLENLTKGGKEARVDQYLFIFLKFIQSVVPTIDYDYTMSVDAGGGHGAAPDSLGDGDDAFVDVSETPAS
ncbi:unnamed protein product [Pylaiella littoralis]